MRWGNVTLPSVDADYLKKNVTGLAVLIAKKYQPQKAGMDFEDLLQEMTICYWRAYDSTLDTPITETHRHNYAKKCMRNFCNKIMMGSSRGLQFGMINQRGKNVTDPGRNPSEHWSYFDREVEGSDGKSQTLWEVAYDHGTDTSFEQLENIEQVKTLVGCLKPAHRKVIEQVFFQELTDDEIKELNGYASAGTVRTLRSEALKEMRRFSKDGPKPELRKMKWKAPAYEDVMLDVKHGMMQKEIAKKYNVSVSTINCIVNKRTKTYGG